MKAQEKESCLKYVNNGGKKKGDKHGRKERKPQPRRKNQEMGRKRKKAEFRTAYPNRHKRKQSPGE